MIAALQKLIAPLHRRVMNLVGRAVVKSIDDAKKLQLAQVELLPGEVRDEIENFQNYGFTSVPKAGAECVVLFVGGRRDHGLAIATDDRRYRIRNLNDGEVCVYNDTGAKIVLKANGDIELTPKSGQKVKLVSDVEVTGTLTASTDVVGGGKSLKNHTHGAGALTSAGCTAGGTAITGGSGGPS